MDLNKIAITDVKINKAPDGSDGGWKFKGIKIEADGTEIYNNQSINKWLEDNDRTWGPHSIS